MVLLRELVGIQLRSTRLAQGRTLRDVSASANVALGYLSELERGHKEASSELLAAICVALAVPLSEVIQRASEAAYREESQSVVRTLPLAVNDSGAAAA